MVLGRMRVGMRGRGCKGLDRGAVGHHEEDVFWEEG